MAKKFRVLSIDGGGVRGIIPACVLLRVERILRDLTHDESAQVIDLFDMVVGTSTGGILAGALVCPSMRSPTVGKYTVDDILQIYTERSDEIFDISMWHAIKSTGGLFREKYPAEGLEEILEDYFEDMWLSEMLKPCMILSFDMKHWRPHFFRQRKAVDDPSYDFLMKDVLRATSAAPTYFKPARVKSRNSISYPLIDGGVIANNPAMVSYAESRSMGTESASDIIILSLGTGSARQTYSHSEIKDWSPLSWLAPTMDISLDDFVTDFQLTQLYNASPIHSLRNYLRVQAVISTDQAPMDNADMDNIKSLQETGERTAHLYTNELESMVKYLLESAK